MKKNYALVLIAFLCLTVSGFGQGSESFTNVTAPAGSYGNGSYTGDNGLTWTYNGARTVTNTYNITGTTIGFGTSGTRNVSATSDANGVGDLTYSVSRYFTGGTAANRSIEVYVNGTLYDSYTLAAEGPIYTRTFTANETGAVLIEFRSTGSRQIVIDDVSWTGAITTDLVVSGTPTDHGASCVAVAATTVQYTITNIAAIPALNVAVSSDNAEFAVSNLSSTTIAPSGTATYDVTFTPATVGAKSATITASSTTASGTTSDLTGTGITTPAITTQPTNQTVVASNTATFNVTANDAFSYQWQVDTGAGFNNVTGGTGATTDSYTTVATTVPMDGNQYRCIITNSCGSVNSSAATLTVTAIADVVITEIMYNPPGTNDYEWIEICNLNGAPEDISNYTIDVNGTTRFTFPASTSIPANSCITVLLGHLVSSPAPECPFTPDYSNPIGNTNILTNGGATITLESPSDDIADSVFYDDADSNPTDGNGSSFHVIDATLDNSDTDTNWQAVLTGGSPGDNTLVSPCTAPELQLVDASNTDRACGFTMNFGSQATTFDTDVTFDIDNDGSSDLTITSLVITGANSGDFSIVSPATPFTVTAGNTQTVIVRFTPSAIGSRNATLTINNNDTDESACTVVLQGTGTNPVPEINVEGDIGTFPDIADGDTTPSGTDNTLFAAQFIGSSQEKTFRIQNIGTAVLNISNVSVGGTNPGDFTISIAPASTVATSGLTIFEVSFSPLAAGVREADITITNNDADEGTYTFRVRGTGNCVASSATITPQSGPVGTIVTVTGSNLSSATAAVNGLAATVNNISNTTMEVTIPVGALTGNIEITDNLGCPGTIPFTVIDTQIGTCEGGSALAELFISEVTDATYGSLTYVEIYNATGSNINLSNYEIRVYGNGSTTSFTSQTLSGTINAGDTFVLTTGTFGVLGNALCATPGGDGSYGDLVSNTLAGVNVVNNEHDFIGLYNSGTLIDAFGEFGVDNWMNSTSITGDRGFNFRRLNTATPIPTTTFSTSDWNIIDWAGSGSSTCVNTNGYSDIGAYDFSTGTPPNITTQPNLTVTSCDITASISVAATEGLAGGNALVYQWYASAPGATTWTAISDNATYSGTSSSTLNILNTVGLDNYQYYCQVREDDATCYTASNATRLIVQSTVWYDNAGTLEWSNGTPDLLTIAVIDAAYNTTSDGSFSACQLIINASNLLTITDNFYVEVENNLTVNGNVLVFPYGSFVQNNDAGIVNGAVLSDKTRIAVEKLTGILNSNQEYTYWSSPVVGETINDGLAESDIDRRFWFNAQNYRDSTQETNNNNATVAGQDDIDDNANDWTYINAGSVMQPGVGYAATHDLFVNPGSYKYIFEGPFNNGIYNIFIYRNDAETADNNWNFIGNPYPSAIDANLFLAANSSIDQTVGSTSGAIFFWSHNTAASGTTNGNENLNYSQSDYAIINMSGQTAGGDGVMPTRHIPSGQGFFISMTNSAPSTNVGANIERGTVVFDNSMRVTGNNSQFFRNNIVDQDNKLWLNLTSDNGVFNQILIAYLDGATNADDGMIYDAHKNLSSNANSILYSLTDANEKKFAIQGKASTSLTLDEVVPLGFYTSINVPTLYTISIAQIEGAFMNDNSVYIKDLLLDTIHNLSDDGDYTFTSETGEFNSRFEIVFQPEALSVNENEIDNSDLSIVELGDGDVKFSVGKNLIIKQIEIIDVTGRTVYILKANNATEVYNLSRLSQAAYIARVNLSNGQTITKKAVKLK